MAKNDKNSEDSFLGGAGMKFNTAGQNAPLPGEKVADTPAPPLFGGPRVWAGTVAVIVAMIALWCVYLQQNPKTHVNTGGRPHASTDAPALDPDAK
jgi:hypothetical protein